MAKHWTQTHVGRKRVSELQKARWAKVHNGASSGDSLDDELRTMEQVLQLWAKLPQHSKNYLKQRIAP